MRVLLVLVVASCWTGAEPVAPSPRAVPIRTPPTSISGALVEDATNEPMVGATIVINTVGGDPTSEITDENGRFRFSGINSGRYKVDIYYSDVRWQRVIEARGATRLDQRLRVVGISGSGTHTLACTSSSASSCREVGQ